jgi:beta-galactosidase
VNQKGVVERDGTPKESCYVFQSYWGEKPMAHIYGHTWPVRWGKPGEEKMIEVYSNCREVELFVNGQSAGVRKRNSADFPAAGLRWLVKLAEGTNIVRCLGRGERGDAGDTLTFVYQTAAWDKPSKLRLREIGRTNTVATIEARVSDRHDVPCLDAANLVRFGLTGDGRLLDNLGTSTGSRAVQLYNGRALIRVRLSGPQAMASVSSEGMTTAFLTLTKAE